MESQLAADARAGFDRLVVFSAAEEVAGETQTNPWGSGGSEK